MLLSYALAKLLQHAGLERRYRTRHRTDQAAAVRGGANRLIFWPKKPFQTATNRRMEFKIIVLDSPGGGRGDMSDGSKIASAIIVATAISGAVFGQAVSGKLYRCTAKDAVQIQDNGRLKDIGVAGLVEKVWVGALIDTLTGAITYSDGRRFIWKIVLEGSSEFDTVLIPDVDSIAMVPPHTPLSIAATNSVRVRDWSKQSQVTFKVLWYDTYLTGTCEIVRLRCPPRPSGGTAISITCRKRRSPSNTS
jgi:hypothetical protein